MIGASDKKPPVNELAKEFQRLELGMDGWTDQSDRNADVRFARWRGQTRDFRKRGPNAFPWPGASDIQEFAVDELVNEDVALLLNAFWEADISALAMKPESMADAANAAQFLRWLIMQMDELDDELELALNTMFQNGMFAMGTFWKEETELEGREISQKDVAGFDNELFILLMNPNTEEEAVVRMQGLFPRVSKPMIKRAVREIRDEGITELRIPVVVKARPEVRAYVLGDDLFFASETMDTDTVSLLFQVDWLEPNEIRQRVIDEGWDEKWAEEVIKRGKGVDNFTNDHRVHRLERRFGYNSLSNKIKVVTAYQRASDKNGVPGWYYTIFSSKLVTGADGKEMVAKNELLNYKPSRHPFIIKPLERVGRRVLDSRGYGETGKSLQNQLKIELDSRIDNASMSTVPPIEYLAGRKPPQYRPGGKNPVRRRGEVGYMETPPSTTKSVEVENTTRNNMRRRYGRPTQDSDPKRTTAMDNRLVKRFQNILREVFNQCWQLHAQFGAPLTYFQVLGPTAAAGMQSFENKGDLFDFHFRFDMRKLDNDQLLAEYETIGNLAAKFDRRGEVDTSQLLRDVIAGVNPQVAERVIRPPAVAQQNEIQDEMRMLTEIDSGMDVDLPQTNIDAELRLQIVQAWLQGSPQIPATDIQVKLQQNPNFRARVEKHIQQLQFVIQQNVVNAQTGLLGTPPSNLPGQGAALQIAG